ncbi:hypothetical protein THOM_0790 [Trachipleistophora hominis]|uniref:Uncharacterized protein n=1 Tax=Trachipleistophora hominis TaxID=72359 RepID=L7JXU2_TRAHO|nr:hypothetical protein THOM_0790 [Trachipleistophora hominis]
MITAEKCAYNENVVYDYEMDVYKSYRGILMEVERKAKNKNSILTNLRKYHNDTTSTQNENDHKTLDDSVASAGNNVPVEYKIDDIMNLLDKLNDKVVDNLKSNVFDLPLHQIYGQLMLYLINSRPLPSNLIVCEVCSNLHAKVERCEHPFHKEYEKLRTVTEQLSKKLKIK